MLILDSAYISSNNSDVNFITSRSFLMASWNYY